ncbi:hypothetical protein C8D70_1254 [Chryseobacterium sp. CBTAP 102]|uniref:hypothetical protein n=1 Tax=Chryseobacterium sp. CBTAP 102 TaxID=2135644 RepID=UPI000D771695|nr:hypothetical protein [Chryseobacterium sp. CBTAP 102]PXW06472.1 hypothetical protein C8D70_1254 [Chryseobacterium sp. CBTAP 102]
MDSDKLKSLAMAIIISVPIGLGIYIILHKFFAPPSKKLYEISLTQDKVIKDSLREYSDRFENDSITYYKNQIISSKEIK